MDEEAETVEGRMDEVDGRVRGGGGEGVGGEMDESGVVEEGGRERERGREGGRVSHGLLFDDCTRRATASRCCPFLETL